MAKENLFMKNAKEKDLIDEWEIAFMTDIVCSDGNNGRAWMFLNGSRMHLYEPAGFADLGPFIETLELDKAEFLKASSFVLNSYMKLKYEGVTYTFRGFAQAKKVIEAVKESCGN